MHFTDLLLPLALAATTAAAGASYTGPCADHLPARFHSLSYDSTSLFREQPKLTPGELECCSDENWRASGFCYFPGPNFPKKEEVVIRGTVPGREGHVGFGSAQVKENEGKMEMEKEREKDNEKEIFSEKENGDMKANEDKKEQRDLVEVGNGSNVIVEVPRVSPLPVSSSFVTITIIATTTTTAATTTTSSTSTATSMFGSPYISGNRMIFPPVTGFVTVARLKASAVPTSK
jgi:hypothetical protein